MVTTCYRAGGCFEPGRSWHWQHHPHRGLLQWHYNRFRSSENLEDHASLTLPRPECANSAQCAPYKHHFEECVERVTRQQEDEDYKGPKEDCVEECKYSVRLRSYLQRIAVNRCTMNLPRKKWLTWHPVFHLTHCATSCAAPKLWRELK